MGLLSQRNAPSYRERKPLGCRWVQQYFSWNIENILKYFSRGKNHWKYFQAKQNQLSSPCSCLLWPPAPPSFFIGSFLLNLSSCVSVSLYFHKFWRFQEQVSTVTVTNSETGGFVSWERWSAAACFAVAELHCNLHFPFPPSLPLQPHTPLTPSGLTTPPSPPRFLPPIRHFYTKLGIT